MMPSSIERSVYVLLTSIIVVGTAYSVLNETFLDTSDPLLTGLPHPLGGTHHFANKKNWLNVFFIKKAWAWTTAVFLLGWLAGLTSTPKPSKNQSTQGATTRTTTRSQNYRLLGTYFVLTAFWILFTTWFFGPALFERVVIASGGECLLPGPVPGMHITVPNEYCYTRSKISTETHPELFQSFLSTPNIEGIEATFVCPASDPNCVQNIRGVPRLRRGHDVSGHLFLLTVSILLLTQQLSVALETRRSWGTLQTISVGLNSVMLALWLLSAATTSLYFHSPSEKVTGFLLGVVAYAASQVVVSLIFSTPKTRYPNSSSTEAKGR
ncbi:hypothetical protein FA15DRAFT_439899 [Coprinopsis marcescibilis]|uniref:Uncharacterized protein n=1 Tax=Coprinopsis marcescibilis TaxID=230819 RepID=A0A5C3L6T3_COPMA|nr:hypothetical protein FA15DRAFT_439899 [Coprinopsis marcescibilis]